jgi:prepilin-type N-terminal cleavage/methylation domain-containing protein
MIKRNGNRMNGFTLVEMAIVIVIFGILLASFLVPLQAQRNLAFQRQTEITLESAKQALIGFAQANGRLPCPATAFSNGSESPLGGGACAQQTGYLPAATLGIQAINSQGNAVDGWENPIRYSITQTNTAGGATTPDFTTSGEMSYVGVSTLNPNLRVCASSTAANCSASVNLINNAVAVVLSTGATGNDSAGKADETENLNAVANLDTVFVSHDIRANDANGEFDHHLVWISPYILYNAMIQAGQIH